MKNILKNRRRATALAVVAAAVVVATVFFFRTGSGEPANSPRPQQAAPSGSNAPTPDAASVELAESQLGAIKLDKVSTFIFPIEITAVGAIDYDEDLSVQVFPNYQGKILEAFKQLGDDVKKGDVLYSIDSPDLVQAESTLIGAAASFELFSKEFMRATALFKANGIAQRELEQATNDEQTAAGALKAARDAVRVFGKTDAEMDMIIKDRKIDSALVVPSPIDGRITARNAQPGLLVQPGNPPAPYTVANLSKMWMLGYVTETDCPTLHLGQPVHVTAMAYPGHIFDGSISKISPSVDPNTHRVMIRSDIENPKHELLPGMLANFVITVQAPIESAALPTNGVSRNGDGTWAAWVTTDRRHFSQRFVKLGLQSDGKYQVLEGLQPGETIVTDGAVFLANILYAPPSD